MLPGQKPKSAALKLVTGNPGKRPIREDEIRPDGEVKKPSFITGRAAKLWEKYAPSLESNGVLTAWDCDMFGTWCCLMAEYQKSPEMFTSAKLGQMRTLGEAFCLIPPGRARFKPNDENKKDPAEKYVG